MSHHHTQPMMNNGGGIITNRSMERFGLSRKPAKMLDPSLLLDPTTATTMESSQLVFTVPRGVASGASSYSPGNSNRNLDSPLEMELELRPGLSRHDLSISSLISSPEDYLDPQTDTYQRLLPKRIDSLSTATTAEMSTISSQTNDTDSSAPEVRRGSSGAGIAFFQQSYAQLVTKRLSEPQQYSQSYVAPPTTLTSANSDKITTFDRKSALTSSSQRGYSTSCLYTTTNNNYSTNNNNVSPRLQTAESFRRRFDDEILSPYDKLKKFMRDGINQTIPEDALDSMAGSRFHSARRASLRAQRQQSERTLEVIDDEDVEEEEEDSNEDKFDARLALPTLSMDRAVSIDASSLMRRGAPAPRYPAPHLKQPIRAPSMPSLNKPSYASRHTICAPQGGCNNKANSFSSETAELFEQFHRQNISSEEEYRPGAYAARGVLPTAPSRREAPVRDRFGGLLRRLSSGRRGGLFGRRSDSIISEDSYHGDEDNDNNNNNRVIDAPVDCTFNENEETGEAGLNLSYQPKFNSIPPELRPVPSMVVVQEEEEEKAPEPEKKKKIGRGLRKMFSRASRATKKMCDEALTLI